ncbi:MAG: luciferase [Chloroflexi bacterium RBG_16_68_14]|nr:MAG: luciferase [Chloroflexi bacterium RBG_16_68_14]
MPRKFRFGLQSSRAASGEEWAAKARKIEELGFSTLFIPDHFTDQLAPLPALMAAADATKTLRLGTLVLDNDYRHPLVLAKELATLDVLSGGRLEIGLGAGWMVSDYQQSGIPYDAPGVRIGRLEEALKIMKGFFAEGGFSFTGRYYTITGHEGTPKPAQKPHPPFLVGGGGRRVLSLAAREADIVAVNFSLAEGMVNPAVAATGSAAATAEKMGWIRKAAGARFDDLEMQVTVFASVVTDDRQGTAERVAPGFGLAPEEVLESPHVLVGTVDQMVEELQRRREEYGFSYVAFSGDVFEMMAPVVSRLAGT